MAGLSREFRGVDTGSRLVWVMGQGRCPCDRSKRTVDGGCSLELLSCIASVEKKIGVQAGNPGEESCRSFGIPLVMEGIPRSSGIFQFGLGGCVQEGPVAQAALVN